MKKQFLTLGITLVLFAVFFTGCMENNNPKNGDKRLSSTEFLGGAYNASILHLQIYLEGKWGDVTEINYTKDGMEHQGAYWASMNENLDWIKTNTTDNCTILCWWDYAMMIEGYAERNVIARFGSLAITDTIAMFGSLDEEGKQKYIEEHEWCSNETIQELGTVLTTTNISSDETKEIMQKYNVSYIFTNRYDKEIVWVFLKAAGKNSEEYYTDDQPNEKCNETLVFKMWDVDPQVYGLQLCYASNTDDRLSDVRIFKVV